MLRMQSPKEIRKRARADRNIINTRSHVQKKYFSLMLVPSYSSGKTRSIRIPYMAFYILFALILAVGGTMAFLHFRAQFLMQVAQYTAENLEQVQEAYETLQEITEEERRRLTEDSINLRSALTQERIRGQEEQFQQRLTYLETLEAIQAYVEGLEEQLHRFEEYRQEILDQLSSNAHIPPVRNMLNQIFQDQIYLTTTLQDLNEHAAVMRERSESQSHISMMAASYVTGFPGSTSYVFDATGELINYIALLELTIEVKAELYQELLNDVGRIAPYIRNYPTIRPIQGRLTSGFGWRRNPFGRGTEMHEGVDIAAPTGTPIRATGGGVVTFSGWSGAYGNKVIINHGMGIQTWYAHNSVNLVEVGQRVARGETIARVGSTGRSTGPHVHYEVRVNGSPVNPVQFFLE